MHIYIYTYVYIYIYIYVPRSSWPPKSVTFRMALLVERSLSDTTSLVFCGTSCLMLTNTAKLIRKIVRHV